MFTLEVQSNQKQHSSFLRFPVALVKIVSFAKGIEKGEPFTVRRWTGAYGIFSGSEFEAIRSEFISRGLATWRNADNHQTGVEFTLVGKRVIARIANEQLRDTSNYPT